MTFLWPDVLWLLLTLPALVWLYLWLLRRRNATAIAYPGLALVRAALGSGKRWRRHVPPALLLLALATLLVAAARPLALVTLPARQQTIILAMDVSGSMRAADVAPDRISAAQTAAKTFIAALPRYVRVGIVAFAGSAHIAQQPTQNRDDLVAAIDAFQLQRGTATGNGIMMALAALFPDAGIDIAALAAPPNRGMPGMARGQSLDDVTRRRNDDAAVPAFTPVAPGAYHSAAIIMLTDGQRTTGIDPLDAAQWAAQRGVRVYTVGIGTAAGETINFQGWSMRVRLDEDTLKAVARTTAADYFYAGTAEDLQGIYQGLSARITTEKKETEITALLALVGAALMLAATALSLCWFGRLA